MLLCFEAISCLRVNYDKSTIIPIGEVPSGYSQVELDPYLYPTWGCLAVPPSKANQFEVLLTKDKGCVWMDGMDFVKNGMEIGMGMGMGMGMEMGME